MLLLVGRWPCSHRMCPLQPQPSRAYIPPKQPRGDADLGIPGSPRGYLRMTNASMSTLGLPEVPSTLTVTVWLPELLHALVYTTLRA